jgi:hypothetical protein
MTGVWTEWEKSAVWLLSHVSTDTYPRRICYLFGRLLYFHGPPKRNNFLSRIKEQGSHGQRSRTLPPFPSGYMNGELRDGILLGGGKVIL